MELGFNNLVKQTRNLWDDINNINPQIGNLNNNLSNIITPSINNINTNSFIENSPILNSIKSVIDNSDMFSNISINTNFDSIVDYPNINDLNFEYNLDLSLNINTNTNTNININYANLFSNYSNYSNYSKSTDFNFSHNLNLFNLIN